MKYAGTYTARVQAQRQAALKRIIRAASLINNVCAMERLAKTAIQIMHTDSGKESRAEHLRDIINIWTIYHDDLEELEDMQKWVCYIAARKVRQAEYKKRQAQRTKEFLQKAAAAAQTA